MTISFYQFKVFILYCYLPNYKTKHQCDNVVTVCVPACPMGSSSSIRFFSTLAQSLSSAPLEHTHTDADEGDLEQSDPDALLRECGEVLRNRPPRPHRDFIRTRASASHNPQIRVMQWNILAQGTRLMLLSYFETNKYNILI